MSGLLELGSSPTVAVLGGVILGVGVASLGGAGTSTAAVSLFEGVSSLATVAVLTNG